jgi:hypothetical protein
MYMRSAASHSNVSCGQILCYDLGWNRRQDSELSAALLSRFFVVGLEQYTYEQFHEITFRLLDVQPQIACLVADAVWNSSRNIRDCVRIGKLAKSEWDVNFLVEKFLQGHEL